MLESHVNGLKCFSQSSVHSVLILVINITNILKLQFTIAYFDRHQDF